MSRQPKMGDRIGALEETMSELESTMQEFAHQLQQRGLILSKLCKPLGLKETSQEIEKSFPQREEIQKVNCVVEEIKPGLLQNLTNFEQSSEATNQEFLVTTTLTPPIGKNHMNEENHYESKNGEGVSVLEVTKNGGEAMFGETVSVVQRRKEKTSVFEEAPPVPDPPDSGRLAAAPPKTKPPDPLSPELHPSKLRDFDQLATLPRLVNNHHHGMPRPPSKPPDAGKPAMMTAIILVTAEESISGESMRFMSLLVEKDLERGVHIAEDTNLKEQNIGSNWSCCKLGSTENQIGQAQNNSRCVREIKRWSNVGSLKLAHVSVVPCVGIRLDAKVQMRCFRLIPPLVSKHYDPYVLAKVKMMLLYSSVLRIAWDPGKFNVFMSKAAYDFCWRIFFISHGACIHIVVEPYDLALWHTVIWGYVSERNFVLPFNMMSWDSSFLVKENYSIEFKFPMVVAADNGVCWRMFFIFYGLLNFVFDRGKVGWMQISTLRTKLFLRRWELIETWIKRWALKLSPNQRKERELGMMRWTNDDVHGRSVKDSVVGEERIAQYLLAVLDTRGTPLHWKHLLNNRRIDGISYDEENNRYNLKTLKQRRSPPNRSDLVYVEDIVLGVQHALYSTLAEFNGNVEDEGDLENLIDEQFGALQKALKIPHKASEARLMVSKKFLTLFRAGKLGPFILDDVPIVKPV
ncbi:mitochondrial GTPase 1-like protein [Trifolium pratense]|uniref:Mitochondrial GTPase 1-like protein n=1 Tax=Trifolium pratense TaxID=57577 RepID=A0A2K3PIS4_TRIPR|nr:mitochondrial GTPase 1-like protein [Trifolium pratense]